MKNYIVKPSIPVAILQLCIVAVFAYCLYALLQERAITKALHSKMALIETTRERTQQTAKSLASYRQLLVSTPDIREGAEKLTWQDVSLQWNDLPFAQLLQRLQGMYVDRQPFVLKSFAFSRRSTDNNDTPLADNDAAAAHPQFTLHGFSLCQPR